MSDSTSLLSDTTRPLVDEESLALARHFLRDDDLLTEDNVWNLAAAIQTAVEDWFESQEHAASVTAMGVDDD